MEFNGQTVSQVDLKVMSARLLRNWCMPTKEIKISLLKMLFLWQEILDPSSVIED